MKQDVVIAGASFAGLALAQRLRGRRVLLLDRDPVGANQTSACGAPLRLVEAVGAADAVQQVHDAIRIHTTRAEHRWDIAHEPFCTFDYARFCEIALRACDAEFVQASVRGLEGDTVLTSQGTVRGRLIADCTGWRAALGCAAVPDLRHRQWRAFGIEAEVACDFPPGLHFYFWPEVAPDGYAWAFPCGGTVRFGVLSYRGDTKLRSGLEAFVGRFGVAATTCHGGFLGSGVYDPVARDVFVVGDGAGQCLPLTGEGIRSAVHAAWVVGDLFGDVLDGRCSLEWAMYAYRRYVAEQRRRVHFLAGATLAAMHLPPRLLGTVIRWFSGPRAQRLFLSKYLGTFPAFDATRNPIG
jgi:flavin-dependent dehydrogenase